jgi:hypothetical protein
MIRPQPERRQFTLTVTSLPGVDPIKSLRRSLKTMLRRDGLRCTGIMESSAVEGRGQSKAPPISKELSDGRSETSS